MSTVTGDTGSHTVLQSGGLTALQGAQVLGGSIELDVGGLHIESLQGLSRYEGRQEQGHAQVTVGYGFSASGGYSQSKVSADYLSVIEPSGIFAGDGGYRINVRDNTHLIGGFITSTREAEDEGRNSIVTGTLSARDLQNYAKYEGESFGIGLGVSNNGGKNDKTAYTTGIGYGRDSDKDTSVTRSGINTRNIEITDEAGQLALTGETADEARERIYTDITTDDAHERSGALRNKFDKDEVFREIGLQVEVTREFQRNANSAIADYYGPKQKELGEKLRAVIEDPESTYADRAAAAEELYRTQYQRVFLETLVGLIAGAPGNVVITKGLLQQAAIKMREESLKNSLIFKGAKDVDGTVYSNVSQESGWFDMTALGGVRIVLDVICGKANERCETETVMGEDGVMRNELKYDEYGYVQFKEDDKYESLAKLFSAFDDDDVSEMFAPFGSAQALPGYLFSRSWGAYGPGDFFDLIVESFAGTHDLIGGQLPGFYDAEGNTSRGRSEMDKKMVDVWAGIAIPLSAPFAISDLIPPELMQILFTVGGK